MDTNVLAPKAFGALECSGLTPLFALQRFNEAKLPIGG
jgi:hypothetical protein